MHNFTVGRKWWKQVAAGFAALCSGQVISIIGNLAVLPIFLSHWSVDRYGEWLALSSLVAYLATLDFGMNMAGANRLTQAYSKGDLDAYNRYLRSALVFYLAIAGAGSALLGLAVSTTSIPRLLRLRVTSPVEASLVLFLVGIQVLWSLPSGLLAGIYRTMGDLARSQWVRNASDITALILTAAALTFGRGMITLAFIQLGCLAATVAYVLMDLRKRHPSIAPGIFGARLSVIRDLVRPSLYFVLIIAATAIMVQGPVLLISARLGGAAVAVFVSTRTLANLVRQTVGTVNMALWPHVTALEAQDQHSRIRLLHRLWVIGSISVSAGVAGALWFEGSDVIRLWTRGRLPVDSVLLRLLLLQLVLQAPWHASSLITGASNRHSRLSWAYLLSSLVAIGSAALLLGRMGLRAVPIGNIIGEGIVCYHFVTFDTCTKIGEAYTAFALRQWLFLTFTFGLALLVAWSIHLISAGPPPLRWMEVGAATTVASAAAVCIVGSGPPNRLSLSSLSSLARS